MTLFDFLDAVYCNTNLELQKEFSVAQDGRLKAVNSMINGQRQFFKWMSYPVLLIQYLLVKLGLKDMPPTRLELAKTAQDAQTKAKENETKSASKAKGNGLSTNPFGVSSVSKPTKQVVQKT